MSLFFSNECDVSWFFMFSKEYEELMSFNFKGKGKKFSLLLDLDKEIEVLNKFIVFEVFSLLLIDFQ